MIPYESDATFTSDGGYFAYYSDHHALRREVSRFSRRDADNYEHYARAVMRQCRFVKPLLLRSAPEPVSNRPRDLGELGYGHSNQAAMEKVDQEPSPAWATTISSHSAPLRCGKHRFRPRCAIR